MAPKFDDQGLITAIAQDELTGDVRMVAWMNAEALKVTLETGKATFFSRSRGRLWTKGETSGHFLHVRAIHADCDGDTLLLRVSAEGPSCHTGRPTCFFHAVDAAGDLVEAPAPAANFLAELEREIELRQVATSAKSYTRSLLDAGPSKIGDKVMEEASEFAQAIAGETPERVASEAADVLYHLLVGLRSRGVSVEAVLSTLHRRSGVSGHVEKASRGAPSD
jgi:phosphoribosyl-ATP pyrophosphohydrolase/phosphoribosyl-AMP cyclohydrolase